jgi:hypothetical protein
MLKNFESRNRNMKKPGKEEDKNIRQQKKIKE